MAAARYWRVIAIDTEAGGDLELSELHLYGSAGRLDATATISSTVAPKAGTVAALQDDDLLTTCRFARDAVRAGGFAIVWDAGAGETLDVVAVRLGASSDRGAFMTLCTLQYSPDGDSWQGVYGNSDFNRFVWPGPLAYTGTYARLGEANFDSVVALLHFEGANESTTVIDVHPSRSWNVFGYPSPTISTVKARFGGASMLMLPGGSGTPAAGLEAAASADFQFGTADFTIEWWQYWVSRTSPRYQAAIQCGYNVTGAITLVTGDQNGKYALTVGTTNVLTEATAGELGQWTHYALTRSGDTFTLWRDGVISASGSDSQSVGAAGKKFAIGCYASDSGASGQVFNGYIDEFRVTKGVARYSTSFTPLGSAFADVGILDGAEVLGDPLVRASAPIEAQVAASSPVPEYSAGGPSQALMVQDIEHGGSGTVYGNTKTKGKPINTPTKARVVLFTQRGKLPIRETWSDQTTGEWVFHGLDERQKYIAMAEDAAGNFRPVAANVLVPEVLP